MTSRAVVELALTPSTEDLFQAGWAVTWNAGVGAARSCDTFLVTEQGPRVVTPTEPWPLKRIRVQGAGLRSAEDVHARIHSPQAILGVQAIGKRDVDGGTSVQGRMSTLSDSRLAMAR